VFPFNLAYPLFARGQRCLIALAKALVGSGERLTFCVFSGSACGGGGAATDSLTLVVVLGGEGRFRGGGRPLGRVASGLTPGVVAERPRPVDDAEEAAWGADSISDSDSEGGSDKVSESVSDTSPSLGTVTVEACLGFRNGLVFA
jgi:hypothetical protein